MKQVLISIFFVVLLQVSFGQNNEVYTTSKGAIDGYDPVTYFEDHEAIRGSGKYSYRWNGAVWYFTSAENRKLFEGNPTRYAPKYSGYCAYGVSKGYKAKIDPEAWSIVDDKLYLNYNKKVREKWISKKHTYIKIADNNWADIIKN